METGVEMIARGRLPVAMSVLVALLAWETLHPFFQFFRGDLRGRVKHIAVNLALSVLNAAMIAYLFVRLWGFGSEWSEIHAFGLLHRFELSAGLHAMFAILLLDFWTYWWHWMNHRIPFFWRFHRVHHSDPRMDVTTANRFHLGEIFFSSVIRVALIIVLGVELWQLALYEILLFGVVQFHHANIALPSVLDRFLRIFIPTPAMHKVHHSRFQPETDSNYSSLLSIWDRIFGTLKLRQDLHRINFGLDGLDQPNDQTFPALVKLPARKLHGQSPRKSA